MRFLRCRNTRACPWKVWDEAFDSDGQRFEHERECAAFVRGRATAKTIADRLAVERVAHLVRAA